MIYLISQCDVLLIFIMYDNLRTFCPFITILFHTKMVTFLYISSTIAKDLSNASRREPY